MRRVVLLLMFFFGAAPITWAGSGPSAKKAGETKNESGQNLKQGELPKGAKPPSAHTNEQPPKLESPPPGAPEK